MQMVAIDMNTANRQHSLESESYVDPRQHIPAHDARLLYSYYLFLFIIFTGNVNVVALELQSK